jgi:hypothetical protein
MGLLRLVGRGGDIRRLLELPRNSTGRGGMPRPRPNYWILLIRERPVTDGTRVAEGRRMRSLSIIDMETAANHTPLLQRDTYEQVRRTLDDALAELEDEMSRDDHERESAA